MTSDVQLLFDALMTMPRERRAPAVMGLIGAITDSARSDSVPFPAAGIAREITPEDIERVNRATAVEDRLRDVGVWTGYLGSFDGGRLTMTVDHANILASRFEKILSTALLMRREHDFSEELSELLQEIEEQARHSPCPKCFGDKTFSNGDGELYRCPACKGTGVWP